MHILTLTWEYPPKSVGGLAQHVYDLSHALIKQGHRITIVTTGDDTMPEYEQDGKINIYRVRPFPVAGNDFLTWVFQLNFALLEKCFEIIQREEPFEIIHAHDWLVAFTARALKYGMRLPLISTIHATEYGRNQGLHNDLQRYISDVEWWLMYESWKVIVCSDYMHNEVKSVFQVPEDKVVVIPNGVNPDNFINVAKNFKRSDYAADDQKIVFFVGRLVPEKGVQVLLEAIPKIVYHYPKVKFVIGGKGPSTDYLRSKAQILGVGHQCYFTGYIDDKTRNSLYEIASVAVFPSTYEPFGIVALEAMAAKVPVVVSEVGGLSEIINHGVDGLKAYAGNPNSLADNIIPLLKDEKLGRYLVKNAFQKIKDQYLWEKIAVNTADVYKRIQHEAKDFTSYQIGKQLNMAYQNQNTGR